jgi:hypothetical protein
MITLIAETDQEKIIKEDEGKYSETKSNTFLYEVSPHLMPYTYARSHYLIPVPWSYFVISENLSVFKYYNNKYNHNYSSKIEQIFFHGTKADDSEMSLMDAPVSNMSDTGQLCGATYRKFLSDPNIIKLDTYDKLGIFNNSYVSFNYEAGNNDYSLVHKTFGTHYKVPLVEDLVAKWGVNTWPNFFKKWAKLKCQPEEFWPSSLEDVDNLFGRLNANSASKKKNCTYSIEAICESHNMVKVNSILLED